MDLRHAIENYIVAVEAAVDMVTDASDFANGLRLGAQGAVNDLRNLLESTE